VRRLTHCAIELSRTAREHFATYLLPNSLVLTATGRHRGRYWNEIPQTIHERGAVSLRLENGQTRLTVGTASPSPSLWFTATACRSGNGSASAAVVVSASAVMSSNFMVCSVRTRARSALDARGRWPLGRQSVLAVGRCRSILTSTHTQHLRNRSG
jgi:hypothetical protein